jgi:hypothetical protein
LTKELRAVLNEEIANPSEDFVKFFVNKIYSGRIMPKIIERYTPIVKKSINGLISDMISDRLKQALDNEKQDQKAVDEAMEAAAQDVKERKIDTTETEREAFFIVKAMLRDRVRHDRIIMRDNQTYLTILMDDNNRKPICRLYLNGSKWLIGFLDAEGKETKYPLNTLDSVFNFEPQLVEAAMRYPEKIKSDMQPQRE